MFNKKNIKEDYSKRIFFWLVIIVGIGAVVRLLWLGNYSLHYDEAREYGLSFGALSNIVEAAKKNSSNPPLHLFLIKFFSNFGISDFYARIVPTLSNILTIFFVYQFTNILFKDQISALFSSFFFSISFTQFRFSNEVRPYSLSLLFASLILLSFELAIQKPEERKWKYFFAILSSIGFFA
ncbi:MAG: hypothetical protein D6734_03485 [Candidatus Schekmanbacteria bacterium]|nr:MAG: hypothetical protein D6734_03485 [Candidatus Schekmanbacteria bacterium]